MTVERVRVISDGTGPGTKVLLGTSSAEVDNVRSVTLYLDATEISTADIILMVPVVDVKAQVGDVTVVCPFCDHEDTHTCKPSEQLTLGGK